MSHRILKGVLWPDTHLPFEDQAAFALMLKIIKHMKLDYLVILGDFLDCYSISDHDKSPARKWLFAEELEYANDFGLDEIDRALKPKCRKIFIEGNHEDRLCRKIQKDPSLYGLITIPDKLHLKKRGWEFVNYRDFIKIGKLCLTHDVGHAGKGAHHQTLGVFPQFNCGIGHTHRVGFSVTGDAMLESHQTVQCGWLGDFKQMDYAHRIKMMAEWHLGLCPFYMINSQPYLVPTPIINYTALIEGELIS